MTRILKIGSILLILIAGWVGVELAFAIHELRIATVEIKQDVREIKQNANGVLIQAGLVLDQARQLAETQQDVARKTAANTERMTREGAEALVRFNTTIEKVNNEILPQMQKTLETADLQIQNTGEEAANTLAVVRKGLDATLAETTATAKELHNLAADPSIKESLNNLAAASKDGAEGVKEVKGAVTDVHEMTTDVKVAVKRATEPANLAFKILSWAWDKIWQGKAAF